MHARKKPCGDCPWRRDAPTGHFPPDAFERLTNTAQDMSMHLFQCHDTSDDKPLVCAGFLARGADHNLRVRLAYNQEELEFIDRSGDHELFDTYREMAIANGVDPSDPVLDKCRDD